MAAKTTTLSLSRFAKVIAPTFSGQSLPAVANNIAAIQCRRSITTEISRNASNLKVSSSQWSRSSIQQLEALTRRNGSTNIFSRPYHVTLRVLDHQSRPTENMGIKDHDHDHDHKKPISEDTIDEHIQPAHTNPIPPNKDPKARLLIGFTCKVCNHRSHKTMSKHAYEHGVVIMQCDHCKNRHLIADHLGWFKNAGVTVEDLVKAKGEKVQKLTRDYQLVKDGEMASSDSDSVGSGSDAEAKVAESGETKAKTELELALEKAAEGLLEWIPKDILEQEEERMKKSQETIDRSKKA